MTLLPLNRLKFHKDIFWARGLMVSVTKSRHIEEGSKVSREFFYKF